MSARSHHNTSPADREAVETGRKDLGTLAGQIRAMLDANLLTTDKELFHDLLNELAIHFRAQTAHEEAFLQQTHPNLLATRISTHIAYENRLTDILIAASTGHLEHRALRSLLDDLQTAPAAPFSG